MGNYLDSMDAYTAFREMRRSPYFVDKSLLIDELIPRIDTTEKYICITRPRRFGKSAAANMIAAFFPEISIQRSFFRNF